MYTKEEAFSYIAALVERFHEQLPSYKKSDYNETHYEQIIWNGKNWTKSYEKLRINHI